MEKHAPQGAKVTFRLLGFKASPYSMPKDTIVNKAAAKVPVSICNVYRKTFTLTM